MCGTFWQPDAASSPRHVHAITSEVQVVPAGQVPLYAGAVALPGGSVLDVLVLVLVVEVDERDVEVDED